MKINFWGDFFAPTVEGLMISEELQGIVSSADFNVVNFEAPVKPSPQICKIPKSGPSHCQCDTGPDWLEAKGFNLVSFANNHMMDYGDDALDFSKSKFTKAKVFGAGTWDEAYNPCIIEKDGVKIGILGVAHYEFGMLADKWDTRYQLGIAWINHPDVDKILGNTRRQVDYLIVFAHAGLEHVEQPLPEWRDRYRSFIDIGCDAVIASHPHIIQGWETYHGKPIIYSLGNFYFPKHTKKPWQWYRSLCVSLELDNDKISLQTTPIVFSNMFIDRDNSSEVKEYIERINEVLNDDGKYMEYVNRICLEKLREYDYHFAQSGYIPIGNIKCIVRKIYNLFIGKRDSFVYMENALRCESHRWCITRGIKLKNNIQ